MSQSFGAAAHNLRMWGHALPIVEKLSEAGIPVAILKGLPQMEELYGDPGTRMTSDVDVLVPSQHASSALTLLAEAGWQPGSASTLRWLTASQGAEAASARPWHMRPPAHLTGCLIDLHFDRMTRSPKPTLDSGVWERAIPVSRDGVEFLVLSPEDQLLFLCYHFVTDRLPWYKLSDIELLLRRSEELDWDYLSRRARQAGVTIAVYLTCRLAVRHAAAPVPDDWQCVRPMDRLRARVLAELLDHYSDIVHSRYWVLVWLLAHDRPWDMRAVWRHIFFPDRVTVAAEYLGHWPSWAEYLAELSRIYLRRIRKSTGRM